MPGLRFPFAELERETKTLKEVASSFLDTRTTWVLDKFGADIRNISGTSAGTMTTLEFQKPLRTVPNAGGHEVGRRSGSSLYAKISGIWEVQAMGSRLTPRRQMEFCGKASTKVELYACDAPTKRIAMWRLELGAKDSPGCYVHAQILGDSSQPPFPKSIPIPRLPSLFVTPMSAVEFVLGELFQDQWAQESAKNNDDALYWRALQKRRLGHILSWYQSTFQNPVSSPWMDLKTAKPDGEMFLAK